MLKFGPVAAAAGFVPAALGVVPGPAMTAHLMPGSAAPGAAASGPAVPSYAIRGLANQHPAIVHPAARLSSTAFRLAVRWHYGQPANASGYSVIFASGGRSAWVFGGTNPGGASKPVAARWNGQKLTPSSLPGGLTGFITEAAAASSRDIWAASQFGRYLVHWDGVHWSVARRWSRGTITGLTVAGPRSVWVFGTTAAGLHGTGTWHFNGQSWTDPPGLPGRIYRASALSRRDIWAVAADQGSDRILRYNGANWRQVHTGTALSGVLVHDILAMSDRDVWVVGNEAAAPGTGRLVLVHWNGASWVRMPTKLDAWAGRLAPDTRGNVLITATPEGTAAAVGLIVRILRGGRLSVTTIRSPLGSGVSDVALARGTHLVMVAGGVLTMRGGDAAIWTGKLVSAAARPDDDD
jgi:hypothetical protein